MEMYRPHAKFSLPQLHMKRTQPKHPTPPSSAAASPQGLWQIWDEEAHEQHLCFSLMEMCTMPRVTPASDEVIVRGKGGMVKAAEHTRPSEHWKQAVITRPSTHQGFLGFCEIQGLQTVSATSRKMRRNSHNKSRASTKALRVFCTCQNFTRQAKLLHQPGPAF